MGWRGNPTDPERPCVVVDIRGRIFTATHLVMIDRPNEVVTKCGITAPKKDSYQATYGNITCRNCRRT